MTADATYVSAIADVLRGIATFLDSAPPLWIWLPLFVLTQPLLSFVHEIGHAGAALALLPGRVAIGIGARGPLVACDLGRLTMAFHPVVLPWRNDTRCRWDTPATRARTGVIALAGPAASLLASIVTWSALVRVDPGLLHDVLFVMTLVSLLHAVVSLVPFRLTDSQGVRWRNDGALIVDALR